MSLALTKQPNGAAAAAELKTIRGNCAPCGLAITIQTEREFKIERFARGGILVDVDGRLFGCPFCHLPLGGALYRNRV